MQSSETFENKL